MSMTAHIIDYKETPAPVSRKVDIGGSRVAEDSIHTKGKVHAGLIAKLLVKGAKHRLLVSSVDLDHMGAGLWSLS